MNMENIRIVLEVNLDKNEILIESFTGAAGYLDRLIVRHSHLFNHPTCKDIYYTQIPYDPEGTQRLI
jgi:hypothetical protein